MISINGIYIWLSMQGHKFSIIHVKFDLNGCELWNIIFSDYKL